MRFGSGPTACWGASQTPTSDAKQQQEDDLEATDQAPFTFDPRIGLLLGNMVGFLVFAVALDLTWEQLRRVLKLDAVTSAFLTSAHCSQRNRPAQNQMNWPF
jgi:hypothetical protein